jgi:hypothetical protein
VHSTQRHVTLPALVYKVPWLRKFFNDPTTSVAEYKGRSCDEEPSELRAWFDKHLDELDQLDKLTAATNHSDPPEPPAGLVECGLHSYRPRERIAADFERFLLKAPTKGIHKYRSRLTDLCQQPGLLRETNYSILDFEY